MRLISWNILAGGGARCAAIVERVLGEDPDIVVLQETLPGRAHALCHALRGAGYAYACGTPRGSRERGMCLLSRLPLRRINGRTPPHAGIYPRGWLEVELLESGWRVAAVYGPAEGPPAAAYWNAAAAWVPRRVSRPFLMVGDFNAGASLVDADGYRFRAGRAFSAMGEAGLVDLWRREHGDRREHTWFSRPAGGRPGRGFRIDHAFASPVLAERVTRCRYDHAVRERGWSDHSLLSVELA